MRPDIFAFLREQASAEVVALRVRGTCMTPHIDDGALLRVRARRAFPGDVLVFRTSCGDLAAHRLLGWRAEGFVTKGDHAAAHDAPVSSWRVLGVADITVSPSDRVRAVLTLGRIVWRRLRR